MSYTKYILGIPMSCITIIGYINYQHFSTFFNSYIDNPMNLPKNSSLKNNKIYQSNEPINQDNGIFFKSVEKPTGKHISKTLKYFWGY